MTRAMLATGSLWLHVQRSGACWIVGLSLQSGVNEDFGAPIRAADVARFVLAVALFHDDDAQT